MRIGFNTDYYNTYNDYTSRIKQVDVEEVRRQEEEKKAGEQLVSSGASEQTDSAQQEVVRRPVEPVELEDISVKFNRNDTYDYIGKDSSPESLDVQKAVSDMQKDSILSQYQFFVGAEVQPDTIFQNGDGTVIRK